MTLRLLLVAALACLVASGCQRQGADGIDVAEALGGEADAGFARAIAPRVFMFPDDHNAHPAFRNEWWYLTGQLQATDGERFGYQLTFFRIALAPEAAPRDSAWATRQLWMGHVALTAIDDETHHHDQRLARGALELAGQTREPFAVWLEDWSLRGEDGGDFPWRLAIETGDFALALTLEPQRAPVLQGDAGLSQKSAAAGNASYYYSITRLATRGTIRTDDGETSAVTGSSWLDREWSTSALGEDQTGWDWFSLQLEDGRDLMLYRLRQRGGGTDPHSAGSVIGADSHKTALGADDFALEPLRWWSSPQGARYPVAWRLRVADAGLDLRVEALVDDQEMATGVRYWEGAVGVRSASSGEVLGRGYLEMTGYDRGKVR
jgi:predicted secreted hydrolase